jgi:hypothetical protein
VAQGFQSFEKTISKWITAEHALHQTGEKRFLEKECFSPVLIAALWTFAAAACEERTK